MSLAVERYTRYVQPIPYGSRTLAFDRNYATLPCEPRILEILRSLEGEESNLAAPCPKGR